MSTAQHLVTAEAFSEMPDPPDKLIELVDGEVIELPPMGFLAGLVKMNLLKIVDHFVKHHDLGMVLPGVGCMLKRGPDTVRAPQMSFIEQDRVPKRDAMDWFIEAPPALAAEVISPHDLAYDLHDKVMDYLGAGTRQVWVFWPSQRAVTVYHPDGHARELGPEAMPDGSDELPGFRVRVADLFEVERRQR